MLCTVTYRPPKYNKDFIYGFTVYDLEVCDVVFSDHMPVIFDVPFLNLVLLSSDILL